MKQVRLLSISAVRSDQGVVIKVDGEPQRYDVKDVLLEIDGEAHWYSIALEPFDLPRFYRAKLAVPDNRLVDAFREEAALLGHLCQIVSRIDRGEPQTLPCTVDGSGGGTLDRLRMSQPTNPEANPFPDGSAENKAWALGHLAGRMHAFEALQTVVEGFAPMLKHVIAPYLSPALNKLAVMLFGDPSAKS